MKNVPAMEKGLMSFQESKLELLMNCTVSCMLNKYVTCCAMSSLHVLLLSLLFLLFQVCFLGMSRLGGLRAFSPEAHAVRARQVSTRQANGLQMDTSPSREVLMAI